MFNIKNFKSTLAIVFIITNVSSVSFSSNYPVDMTMKSECQNNGSVRLCRAVQYSGYAVLDIYYDGFLIKEPGLKAYIQINYQEESRSGLFTMRAYNPAPYATPAFVRITAGCIVGEMGGCKENGTSEMRNLLFWAQQPTNYILNELDLEIAFVSDSQSAGWDNKNGFGTNYKFHFSQK